MATSTRKSKKVARADEAPQERSLDPIKYKVVNSEGKEVGTVDLDPEVFGAPIQDHMVHDAITWQRNKKRAGTHSTLSKGVMKGGGKKPWRQKGTGRARAGSNTSPVWVGGAIAHGPKPHGYETRISKRARRQALLSVLSSKVATQTLVVLDSIKIESGKTKEMAKLFGNVGITRGGTALLLGADKAAGEWKASRNLASVELFTPESINTYDLARLKYLVCTMDGVSALQTTVRGRVSA